MKAVLFAALALLAAVALADLNVASVPSGVLIDSPAGTPFDCVTLTCGSDPRCIEFFQMEAPLDAAVDVLDPVLYTETTTAVVTSSVFRLLGPSRTDGSPRHKVQWFGQLDGLDAGQKLSFYVGLHPESQLRDRFVMPANPDNFLFADATTQIARARPDATFTADASGSLTFDVRINLNAFCFAETEEVFMELPLALWVNNVEGSILVSEVFELTLGQVCYGCCQGEQETIEFPFFPVTNRADHRIDDVDSPFVTNEEREDGANGTQFIGECPSTVDASRSTDCKSTFYDMGLDSGIVQHGKPYLDLPIPGTIQRQLIKIRNESPIEKAARHGLQIWFTWSGLEPGAMYDFYLAEGEGLGYPGPLTFFTEPIVNVAGRDTTVEDRTGIIDFNVEIPPELLFAGGCAGNPEDEIVFSLYINEQDGPTILVSDRFVVSRHAVCYGYDYTYTPAPEATCTNVETCGSYSGKCDGLTKTNAPSRIACAKYATAPDDSQGACMLEQECSALSSCGAFNWCGPGYFCAVDTCCGAPVCVPECVGTVATSKRSAPAEPLTFDASAMCSSSSLGLMC